MIPSMTRVRARHRLLIAILLILGATPLWTVVTRADPGDIGFQATINNERSETLVIDRDSTGTLWATWVRGGRVYIARTTGSDTQWGAPFTPAVKGSTTLSSDDISSVVAFGPGKIGVMWSNQ